MAKKVRNPPVQGRDECIPGQVILGSHNRRDQSEPEQDPSRDPQDTDEYQPDPGSEEYVWPTVDEQEDD